MTRDNKEKINITDIQAIEKCPELTTYIMKNRVKSVRKTAVIVAIIVSVACFVAGLLIGSSWTSNSIPNNVVQVQVTAPEASTSESK